ncbi:hypothetical protein OVW19_28700, partial [Klebsiella pneumoniae]|uniref:hypothetical protein n=1 Tax=Klebsiella pneumoniae TaxID=573 RepID=UPI00226DC1C5
PGALADAVFPAGVLLPLMARDQSPVAGTGRAIGLDAEADGNGPLRVRVTDEAAPDAASVERVGASLADLYGERARVRVQPLGAAGAEI